MYTYAPEGVCPSEIQFSIEDGKLSEVSFTRGCNGNLKAISTLVEGMPVEQVIAKLKGITCGHRSTSCSDQLVLALEKAIEA